MTATASKGRRRRHAVFATLASLALLLQGLTGFLPNDDSAAAATSPFGALVICTPDGIRILGPNGDPQEVPEGGAPAVAGDPCRACCLSKSCCTGLPNEMAALDFAPDAALSLARPAPVSVRRQFPRAKPGRGPPPARTSPQTV